ncbi:hypothetical protein [Roseobacter sp. CCS2]|uniref:hypothetical protein n=1 Tax=Roseobacter sp. CCS2 TaxID=391593 RepID=UPI00031089A2|nr:hypothetical protein [Roseobacter sp. CCS2]
MSTRTLFDIGNEVIATFENGILVRDINLGTIETVGFTSRVTEYDVNGQPTSIGTVYADDLRVTESFENGIRTQTLLRDGFFGDGAKAWAEITLTHDAEGNIATRMTKLDNGLISLDIFLPGVSETRYDYSQTRNWEFIDTKFDGNGTRLSENVIFDNGVVQMTDFEDGVRISSERSDIADVFNWETITTSFDFDGVITERETTFDNGTQRFELFDNGTRSETVQLDNVDLFGNPPLDGGAKPWEEIITRYDFDGVISERETTFDDGTQRFELFDNGTRSETVQLDNVDLFGNPPLDGGAKPWEEIITRYDFDGVITERETTFDNGTQRFELFDNGTRSETVQLDNVDLFGNPPLDGGAKPWEEIITRYDFDGVISERETTFDDGTQRFELFDNGTRSETVQLDNVDLFGNPPLDGGAKPWEEIITRYDFDGVISERETTFDDGTQRFELFDNGTRSETVQLDNVDLFGNPPLDGGAKPWEEIITRYDFDGVISERETTFDDGVEKVEQFEAGLLIATTEEDVFDFKVWDTKSTTFDEDGNVSVKAVVFDDDDVTYEVFETGVLSAFLEIDADGLDDQGNPSWGVRLTEYGSDGPMTTTYVNPLDLTAEYLDFLSMDFV